VRTHGPVDPLRVTDEPDGTTGRGFFVWFVNALASHPVLVWRSHALRDRRRPGRLLWRPKARA